jgi:hypothetical protein
MNIVVLSTKRRCRLPALALTFLTALFALTLPAESLAKN